MVGLCAARVRLVVNLEIGIRMLDNVLLRVIDCNASLYELIKDFNYY